MARSPEYFDLSPFACAADAIWKEKQGQVLGSSSAKGYKLLSYDEGLLWNILPAFSWI